MTVYQDGREFYDEDTGKVVFSAELPVKDCDMIAAKAARREFEVWAERQGLQIEWAKV